MARISFEDRPDIGTDQKNELTFQAHGEDRIELPSSEFISDAHMTRDGDDLILETPNGEVAVIEGYFAADPSPLLQSPEGAVLTPELVDSFARSPQEYAANNTASDQSPVGAIEEVKGEVKVTRADGTVETVTIGTPIYEGDIIETDATGAVNIVFIDETSMAISENARMAIDQYSFDPATESGTTNFSVLRGLFVFTSGLIGRDDPDDVHINTPVGSIGIRGTIIAGQIDPDGESNISVLEGAIVVKNGLGETTLSDQFETVKLNGFDQPMESLGVVAAADITARFSSIGNVAPTLFSTINETVQQQSADPNQSSQPQSESPSEPAEQQQMQQQEAPQAPAPAPEPVTQLPTTTTEIISLNNNGSGLPSTSTVMGHSDTLATSTNTTTTTSSSSTSSGSTSGAMAPAPVTSTTTEAVTSTTPTTTTVTNPLTNPVVIGGGTGGTTTPLPPTVTYNAATITGFMKAGTVLGTLSSSIANADYKFAGGAITSADGNYEIVGNQIKLTAHGASLLNRPALVNYSITATDTTDPLNTATSSHTLNVNPANTGFTLLKDNYPGNNQAGYSITAIGDKNGDGYDDFMLSNNSSDPTQNHSYLLMGSAAVLADRASLTGTTLSNPILGTAMVGLVLVGGDTSNSKVVSIGDFDGDGKVDYIIGQQNNDIASGEMSGNVAIVRGDSGLDSDNRPTEFITFTGTPESGAQIGASVSGVGDFDNDGYADVIIGAPNWGGSAQGAAFLVKGGNDWSSAADLDAGSPTLPGTGSLLFGSAVAGIGDFNGDGYSDFAIGAVGGNGQIKIYTRDLITGEPVTSTPFTINGTGGRGYGQDISGIGDINGDGLSDIMFSDSEAAQNLGYIAFGDSNGASVGLTLDITLSTGYKIIGGNGVGDFNGDGRDDFAVTLANSAGSTTYVVFGNSDFGGAITSIDKGFLDIAANAMKFSYAGANSTNDVEVSGVGDINGDGYDDFAMGVPDLNAGAPGDGGVIVVYGRENAATGIVGTSGNDTLSDGGVAGKSLRGGAGNDTFVISRVEDAAGLNGFLNIDGGGGLGDKIKMVGDLDFRHVNFEKISGIEGLEFSATGQTITLTMENLFNLLKSSDDGTLKISSGGFGNTHLVLDDGIAGDSITSGLTTTDNDLTGINQWLDNAGGGTSTPSVGGGYETFQIGGYKLLIDANIQVDAQ